ncbi:MAG: GerMN domain-containing protein [Desulfobacterales bacterium]|nr:GerMN domain-containing protein [Desulfobacterales bacterium]
MGQNVRILSPQTSNKSTVHLYFADKENNFLSAEKRFLYYSDNTVDTCRAIIIALIEGPEQGLMRTIPADTKLRAVFITEDATAYVDLTESVRDKHPGGSQSELFTIYSIVNSLILNTSEIESVKILIGGRESMTLAGHIDLRFPFKANMLLIR